jgi:UDP-glucose 4-epimerase
MVIFEAGSKSKIRFTPYQEIFGNHFEDMQRRVPDISKARESLGWTPTKNIRETIRDILESQISKKGLAID